jgi:hypothetical protein
MRSLLPLLETFTTSWRSPDSSGRTVEATLRVRPTHLGPRARLFLLTPIVRRRAARGLLEVAGRRTNLAFLVVLS